MNKLFFRCKNCLFPSTKPDLQFDEKGICMACKFTEHYNSIDWNKARSYEDSLLKYATLKLSEFENLKIISTASNKGPLISFIFDDIHANDIGSIVDECGVAVRVGHHCAMPAMEAFGVGSTVRASFSMYNTKEDIDFLVAALHEVRKIFA